MPSISPGILIVAHDQIETTIQLLNLNFGIQGGRLWVRLSDQGSDGEEWEGDSRERPIPGVDA